MSEENFFGYKVNVGSLLEEKRSGWMDTFIVEGRENYPEMKHFHDLCKDKRCLLDVGCAVGMFSLVFCCNSTEKTAHAFDASHFTQLSIMQNIALNPQMKIYYHKIFLGDRDAITPYYSENDHALAVNGNDRVVMVQMDSFCALTNIIPDVIKMDTEGFEYNILIGGKQTILNYRPLMFIELHPKFTHLYKTTIDQIFDIQKELSYTIKDINEEDVTLKRLKDLKEDALRTVWKPL